MALKEPWGYDYPEHVDVFKNLKIFITDELAKEKVSIVDLADFMHNINEVIEIFKRL